jgi:hypothetical protein
MYNVPPPKNDDTLAPQPTTAMRPPGQPPPKRRSDSGLFLPVWSVALMLFVVFAIAFGTIGLVIGLGGNPAAGGSPRIVIITAIPSNTPLPSIATPEAPVTNLLPADTTPGALPTFALEGPTLLPVILSPTPLSIGVGSTVVVNADSLNVRGGAGLEYEILFTTTLGATFSIIDGPVQSSGLTWWRVQNPDNPQEQGWAAAEYLDAQPASIVPTQGTTTP